MVTTLADSPRASRTPDALSVGVIVWLASELMFFAGLFAGWFTLRSENHPWPPDGVELETVTTAIATVILVSSSLVMHLAVVAARKGDRTRAVRWLFVTMLMGAIFLANLAFEYHEAPFSISSNAYGSIFFLMTGFHGLHVIGGILLMAAIAAVISGRTRTPVGRSVHMCAYYWHFVDAVWVAMFLTIYVIQ